MRADILARRREHILDAATELFTRMDYHGVRMDAVAAAAGVGKPTLYRYFDTKEALFFAALDQSLVQLAEDVEQDCHAAGSAEECLRQAIGLIFERVGRLAPALRAIEAQADTVKARRDTLRAGFRRLREKIAQLLDRGVARGEFNPVDTELAAIAIVGAVRMAAMVASTKRKGADLVADLLLRGLARDTNLLADDDASGAGLTAGAVQ